LLFRPCKQEDRDSGASGREIVVVLKTTKTKKWNKAASLYDKFVMRKGFRKMAKVPV
jgi:hypothetical protein